MKTITCLLALTALLSFSGCTSDRHIGWRETNYSSWYKSDRIDKGNGTTKISNLSVEIIGDHEAKITGVVSCWYTETGYDEQTHDTHFMRTSGTTIRHDTEWRKRTPEKKEFHPEVMNLENPYGPNIEMEISSSGTFSGRFELYSKYYFKNLPSRKPYYEAYHKTNPNKLKLNIDRPKGYPDFGKHSTSLPKFSFIEMETDKAKSYARNYAKNLLCPVTLSFKEQVTRRNVSPQITITPLNVPSYEDRVAKFKNRLESEFAGDGKLVDLGMKSGKHYLDDPLSKTNTDTAQSESFTAWVGSKYKIETVHGEFNYFRGFITPSSSEPIDKLVLLVEKGEKIRMQEVREGEGGSMVDSD